MELVTYYLNQGLSFIIPLIILLGLLIFVHELGHFLVAKYYGVKVEVFSLGFGKRIFSFKRGDTEYCVSWIPFGGYVKMYGDDPTAEIPESQKSVSFTHKPVGQRIAVVLAGPLMNLFFAALLFTMIAMVGEEMPRTVVGDLPANSAAFAAGFRPEDEIKTINGKPVKNWVEVREAIENNRSGGISVVVNRAGQEVTIQTQTKLIPNQNVLDSALEVGDIEGLSFLFRSSHVAVSGQNSALGQSGALTGDKVVSVDGIETSRWQDIMKAFAAAAKAGNNSTSVEFEREREKDKKERFQKTFTLSPELLASAASLESHELGMKISESLGFDIPDLYVANVLEGSAASDVGIKKNDKIVEVNGPIKEWQQLVATVQSFQEGQPPLKVVALRDGQATSYEIIPKKISQELPTGKEKEIWAIGVVAGLSHASPLTYIERTLNPWMALKKGVADTWLWTKNTALSFLRLIQNRVSAKSIGGPIMIGQLASKTFELGLSPFLKIMAIISINLFVLNLLPVPVLDGGHLVFFTIEALRGAPLSMRKMEIAQQVGLVILMSLMVFALFNDVSRLFN